MIKQGSLQYFCDRCKNPIEEDEVRTISILFDSGASSYHYCPDCLKEYGFLSEGTEKQSPEIDWENERILRRQIFKILKELGVPVEKRTMVKFFNIYRQKEKQKKKRMKKKIY